MEDRRHFLKTAGVGALALSAVPAMAKPPHSDTNPLSMRSIFNVRDFGAKGDGVSIDSPAINRTIDAAEQNGGGTVFFPAGTYASYSIHLKSRVALQLDSGATIVAASVPDAGTTSGGYDAAEPNGEWEQYQDYGHNHWHNSLLWGEGLHDVAIIGTGLIWGKGLSRGLTELPRAESPGVGNKAIALKNCRNVLLRDFAILKGGHFGILATGVDNLTIDNLTIDTDRDGMDIDCCRNVRIGNCSVNSPWDDGICPKSSFALGYARSTENITINNCYVTGAYELGTLLDGTWKRIPQDAQVPRTGRIKCGTESNGGFKNITVANCVFDGCRGIALETVDGAQLEDIAFTNITMRDCTNTPIFLRLGTRMRTPKGNPVGTLKRVLLSNIVSHNCVPQFACIIAGVPGHRVEDIKLSDLYLHHCGGGTTQMAELTPAEYADKYPDPRMFGDLPASGFFLRHGRNLEFSNVEIATEALDARPAFWMEDVQGADFFRLKLPVSTPRFRLSNVTDFSVLASRGVKDITLPEAKHEQF
jgi:polygalacturonase